MWASSFYVNSEQRIERVREAEWFICHGKTHKGIKVDVEDWADVACQLVT